jgi:hypothetical protein
MSDSFRTDGTHALEGVSGVDRDAKIEELLLAGLDHYFASRYEQAINVWTRALFFDRSHPRARAYIERARSALAEQQRETEELLHAGVAACHRGETAEAKRLLRAAVDSGAPADEAHALLDRLSHPRAEDAARPPIDAVRTALDAPLKTLPTSRTSTGAKSRAGLGLLLAAVGVTVGAGAYQVAVTDALGWGSIFTTPGAAPGGVAHAASRDLGLPLPRRG